MFFFWNRNRALFDKALEELILQHWGEEARPPAQTVLAIAATLGYFRRQHASGPSSFPLMLEDPATDIVIKLHESMYIYVYIYTCTYVRCCLSDWLSFRLLNHSIIYMFTCL